LNTFIDLFEFIMNFIVFFNSSCGYEFNFLIDDLLVLSGIHISDVFNINCENGHSNSLRNPFFKLSFELSVSMDVRFQSFGSNGLITIG
jgi:hypothetical protein